jgi:Ser/Thr protein kinase RdoA (MazF antagonist)
MAQSIMNNSRSADVKSLERTVRRDLAAEGSQSIDIYDIVDDYQLGEPHSLVLLRSRTNKIFMLTTCAGCFIVRCSSKARAPGALQFEHRVLFHLAKHGFPVAPPVLSRGHNTWVTREDRLWTVSPYIDGQTFKISRPSHLTAAGRALAIYHRTMRNFQGSPGQREGTCNVSQWLPTVGATSVHTQPAEQPAVDEARIYLIDALDRVRRTFAAAATDLPQLVLHGDLARGNLLFQGEELVTVLDFDNCYWGWRIEDLAVPLKNLCRGEGKHAHPDVNRVAAFMAAYNAQEPLTDAELALLPAVLQAHRLRSLFARYDRLCRRIERGDLAKLPKRASKFVWEVQRLRWLQDHHEQLAAAFCAGRN